MKKSTRKKLRRVYRSLFYRIYFAVVLVGILAIVIGSILLGGWLTDYETAQPVYVAEDAIRMFEQRDFETLYSLDSNRNNIAEGDKDFYLENMNELAEGKEVTFTEGFSLNPDETVYNVLLDGERFASFTLVPSGEKTPRGNRLWTLGYVTSFVSAEKPAPMPTPEPAPVYTLTITVPEAYTVSVDGTELTEKEISKTGITNGLEKLLPPDVTPPMFTEYTYETENKTPEVKAVNEEGTDMPVTADGYNFSCALPEANELRDMAEGGVFNVAKRLSMFFTRNGSQYDALYYCAQNSPAHTYLTNYDNTWVNSPLSVRFENMTTDHYYRYGPNCFSCRISYDYVTTQKDYSTKVFQTVYTLYFIRANGRILLYNLTTN